jgi:hypothetical protein
MGANLLLTKIKELILGVPNCKIPADQKGQITTGTRPKSARPQPLLLKQFVGSNETVIQAIPSSNSRKFINWSDIKPFERTQHLLSKPSKNGVLDASRRPDNQPIPPTIQASP